MAEHEPLVIERAKGCYLYTTDGQRLFDGVSSLWCNVHGHRRAEIDAAIRDQLDRVAHVTSLGMSCETTERLAEQLTEITPGDLAHIFFSSDGSSSIEAALKMALQYWAQRDDPRPDKTRYVALGSAYHGDTTGGVSLGGIPHFHQLFAPILFSPQRIPAPCSYRLPADAGDTEPRDYYASQFGSLLQQHHDSLAAVVMEPLVQGAAGMITHPAGLLSDIRRLCDEYDVLLICDEVATGFGRTGTWFACDQESVTPDILCIGKGLTGGYLPMAATIARPHVYEAFLAPTADAKQFFHGHTYGGNPLAAAAALASIELLQSAQLIEHVPAKSDFLRSELARLQSHPHVGDIRGRGLMVGIELVADRETKAPFDPAELIGRRVCQRAIDTGVWVRPLGDVVILMPPLVATEDELRVLAATVANAINAVLPQPLTAAAEMNHDA